MSLPPLALHFRKYTLEMQGVSSKKLDVQKVRIIRLRNKTGATGAFIYPFHKKFIKKYKKV